MGSGVPGLPRHLRVKVAAVSAAAPGVTAARVPTWEFIGQHCPLWASAGAAPRAADPGSWWWLLGAWATWMVPDPERAHGLGARPPRRSVLRWESEFSRCDLACFSRTMG